MKYFILAIICCCSMSVKSQTHIEWKDSLRVLNEKIRVYPSSTDLRLKKAAVNIELDQWEYAIEEYSKVLELDEKNLAALYYRAYAYTHLKNYDLAKVNYERFLSIMPKNFEAQLGLAMVKRKMGRKTDAMDEFNKLVQMFPDSTLSYAARAGYETELEQYDVALFDWDEAIRRDPKNADLVASKVDVLLKQKKYDDARKELSTARKRGVILAPIRSEDE